jgi:hypothetical protein
MCIVNVPHSKHFTGHFTKKNLINPLTYAFHSGINTTCMAMRLVVATTEATYATRVRDPFQKTANVAKTSSLRSCGEARWVSKMKPIGS